MRDAEVDWAATPRQGVMRVDCHAHVFTRACKLAPDRRYTPTYEAPLASYLALLDRYGLSHGMTDSLTVYAEMQQDDLDTGTDLQHYSVGTKFTF